MARNFSRGGYNFRQQEGEIIEGDARTLGKQAQNRDGRLTEQKAGELRTQSAAFRAFYEQTKQDGAETDDVMNFMAFPLGSTDDGWIRWLVPVSNTYSPKDAGYRARYSDISFRKDPLAAASDAAGKAKEDADAEAIKAETEAAIAQARAEGALKVAEAQRKAAEAQRKVNDLNREAAEAAKPRRPAIELSVSPVGFGGKPGQSIVIATDPNDADAQALHPGVAIAGILTTVNVGGKPLVQWDNGSIYAAQDCYDSIQAAAAKGDPQAQWAVKTLARL